MIGYRHVDPRFPFLWEDPSQPAGRWRGSGEDPVQAFADTPDGAWAELLRHEEITDSEDVATIRRSLWAVDLGERRLARPRLPIETLTGGPETYEACRREARRLRGRGQEGLVAPSAALVPGGGHGWRVDGGLRRGPARDGKVVVLLGRRPDLVGWRAVAEGRPDAEILAQVRPLFG